MQLLLIKNILRTVKSQKVRFTMIAIVVSLGIASYHVNLAFVNLKQTYTNSFNECNMASFTIQSVVIGNPMTAFFDEENATLFMTDFIATHPQIAAYELRIIIDVGFDIDGHRLFGRIVAFNTTSSQGSFRASPSVNGYRLLSGTGLQQSSNQNMCVVDSHLADYWGLKDGSQIKVGENKTVFSVKGVVASPEYLMNQGDYSSMMPSGRTFGVIFAPLEAVQQLLNIDRVVNEISVRIKDHQSQTTREEVADELKAFLTSSPRDLKLADPIDFDNQISYSLLKLDIEEAEEIGVILPVILLLMAIAGLYVLLSRMIVAERKDIGVAQALGYSKKHLIFHYVGISLFISAFGSIIGVLLGILFGTEFSVWYISTIGLKYPASKVIFWEYPITGLVLGLITGLCGGYFPARSTIQNYPAESLRFDPALHITSGKIPRFERLLEKCHIHFNSSGMKMPLRNFFRSKRRTGSSLLGIIISITIILVGFSMFDSTSFAMERQYNVAEDWDLRIDYNNIVTNSSDIVTAIGQQPNVDNVTSLFVTGGSITSNFSSVKKEIQLIGIKKTNDYLGHKFILHAGQYESNGLCVSMPIAEKLNVDVGDLVNLEIARLIYNVSDLNNLKYELANVSIEVTGITDELNGLIAYTGLTHLQILSNIPTIFTVANSVIIKLHDDSDTSIDAMRSYIYTNMDYEVRTVSSKAEQKSDFYVLIASITEMLYALAFFAVAISVTMIYNTVSINLQERKREIATLETIGTPDRKIWLSITVENTLIFLVGTIIGFIFGYILLNYLFMSIFATMEFFRIPIYISVETIVYDIGITYVGMLVAQYFPLRQIMNMNLAEATKERIV